jgi:hypothetical protein
MTHKPVFFKATSLLFSAIALSIVATGLFIMPPSANANTAHKKLGQHGDWSTYTYMENGEKVCFMASSPLKSEGNYKRRGEVFTLITHRPGEETTDVVSIIAGYPYRTNSEVEVRLNGKKFTLFTQSDTAWAPDSDTDHRLTQAIQKGSTMVVKGTSSRGTLTTDTYSLKGSSAAYRAISRACQVK